MITRQRRQRLQQVPDRCPFRAAIGQVLHQQRLVGLPVQAALLVHFSATSIEMVRGILATCHVFLGRDVSEKDVWKMLREDYAAEPFVRIVKERSGIHRYPEPKLVVGRTTATSDSSATGIRTVWWSSAPSTT